MPRSGGDPSSASKDIKCSFKCTGLTARRKQRAINDQVGYSGKERKQSVHWINNFFKCNIYPKTFIKRKPLADHVRKVHRTPNTVCPECGKILKSHQHHKEHMEIQAVRHLNSYAICIENE